MLVCALKGSSFSDKSIKIQTASKETEQRHYSWNVQASAFILTTHDNYLAHQELT